MVGLAYAGMKASGVVWSGSTGKAGPIPSSLDLMPVRRLIVVPAFNLPWPHKVLWPNGRGHWGEKARQTKKHRNWAYVSALGAGLGGAGKTASRIDWSVTFYPKTRHPVDNDNCRASLKAYADGIADALGCDDKLFNAPAVTFGEPIKGGLVMIEVKPL